MITGYLEDDERVRGYVIDHSDLSLKKKAKTRHLIKKGESTVSELNLDNEQVEDIFDLIAELGKTEGLLLDPVYTGKAFYGMVSELAKKESGCLPDAKQVVFIHTGGLFGIFPQQAGFGLNHENPPES